MAPNPTQTELGPDPSMNPALTVDLDGIAWVTFDAPDAKVNVLNRETMEQLEHLLGELESRKDIQRVIFASAKPGNFIAGADIKDLANITSPENARDLARYGQKLFQRIATLQVPTVALIDGACLGGGCELALACTFRIASDNPKTQIGLPETQLGIIPGWGGTQRLPRLIGLREALDLICSGKVLKASKAKRLGLVDEVVPTQLLKAWGSRKNTHSERPKHSLQNGWPLRPIACSIARKKTLEKTHGQYPAPLKAIDAIERGLATSLPEGLEIEAGIFSELATTEISKNLIRLFFLREGAKKVSAGTTAEILRPARRVGVLGAGVMGAGIAQWLSSRGIDVRLRDVKPEFLSGGLQRIASIYQEGVQRRKLSKADAQRGLAQISTTTDWTGFANRDLVIEVIIEDEKIKKETFTQLEAICAPDTIFATNTSAIPLRHLAVVLKNPSRLIGLHFFNPVHKMMLVEVVVSEKSSPAAVAMGLELVKHIGKIPVVVKDRPGFLVNRVLLPYLNEAGWLLAEGHRIEAIDRALLKFGMPMGPLRLIDEIGIDVGYYVAKELSDSYGDRMKVAPILETLHKEGLKGRKGNKGFYLYEKGKKIGLNPGIKASPHTATAAEEEIQQRCVVTMINEAARCLEENIVASADDVDRAMVLGTGFAPFRGGLMKYADSLGAIQWVEILQKLEKNVSPRFAPAPLLVKMSITGKKFCD